MSQHKHLESVPIPYMIIWLGWNDFKLGAKRLWVGGETTLDWGRNDFKLGRNEQSLSPLAPAKQDKRLLFLSQFSSKFNHYLINLSLGLGNVH
jgi:hypothetical protein